MQAAFQQVWSCKEAFVKARGDGLGFAPLSRIEVEVLSRDEGWGGAGAGAAGSRGAEVLAMMLTARLTVDGVVQSRWRVDLQRLARGHWVAVALAPPDAVVDEWGVSAQWVVRCLTVDVCSCQHSHSGLAYLLSPHTPSPPPITGVQGHPAAACA